MGGRQSKEDPVGGSKEVQLKVWAEGGAKRSQWKAGKGGGSQSEEESGGGRKEVPGLEIVKWIPRSQIKHVSSWLSLVILGGVAGKTALVIRFTGGKYHPATLWPVIGVDFEIKIAQVSSGEFVKVQLWDTPGQERCRTFVQTYLKGLRTNGIMAVFSISDRSTFEVAKEWIRYVKTEKVLGHDFEERFHCDIPILLVGTMCDLPLSEREVSLAEAQAYADQNGLQYLETSAKDGTNVDVAFSILAQMSLKFMRVCQLVGR